MPCGLCDIGGIFRIYFFSTHVVYTTKIIHFYATFFWAGCQWLYECNISKLDKLSNNLEATDNKFGGCTLEQEGNDFYITGADAVRKKLGNDDVRMFTLSFPNADGTYTLDNLDLTGDPNFISVSTANNVWVDAVYNAIAPCGQTGVVSDKVKMCAYAISQTIQYLDKSDVFPVCTKDTVTINYSRFKSGVGDKTTRVVIAHF